MWYLIGNKMMNSTARTFHAQVRLERCKTDGDIIIKGKLKRPHVRLNLSWFVNNMSTSFTELMLQFTEIVQTAVTDLKKLEH